MNRSNMYEHNFQNTAFFLCLMLSGSDLFKIKINRNIHKMIRTKLAKPSSFTYAIKAQSIYIVFMVVVITYCACIFFN